MEWWQGPRAGAGTRWPMAPIQKKLSAFRNTTANLRGHGCYRLAGEFACNRL
jgi:hypothetical protein